MRTLFIALALVAACQAQTWSIAFNAGPGTVTITNGSTTISGSGTNFTAADVDAPICDSAQVHCQRVASVSSTTAAALTATWSGTTLSAGSSYGFQQYCHAPANASFTVTCPANFTAGNVGIGAAWLGNQNTNNVITLTDGNGAPLYMSPSSPCLSANLNGAAGRLWVFWTPYLFGGTNTISFNGNPADIPNDVYFIELVAQSGFRAVFDTDVGSCANSSSSTNPTSTMTTTSGDVVIGVGKFSTTTALASPYTSYTETTSGGAVGYILSSSTSVTTTPASAGVGPGGLYAGAMKWVARPFSSLSGKATIAGKSVLSAPATSASIAGVCTPTAGTALSGTATTGTCNSTGATLEVCSVAASSGVGAPFTSFGDSLGNTWQHAGLVTHAGDGSNQIYWTFSPTTGSSQTFHVTASSSIRVTLMCRAYSGTLTTAAVLDQQPTPGFGAGASCQPTTQVPGQANELAVTGFSGNGLSGTGIGISNPFSTFTVESSNTTEWNSGYADSIMTTVEPIAPHWSITGDSGLNCTAILFRP